MRATLLPIALLAAGCPSVDLGDDPGPGALCRPDRGYFADVIWPEYLAPADAARSCIVSGGCHDASNAPRSALRLEPDVDAPGAMDRNYDATVPFLRCGDPMSSPLVTRPLAGLDPHSGGDLFPGTDDPAVVAFQGWFP